MTEESTMYPIRLLAGFALVCVTLSVTPAAAQQYPVRVVKFVVPQTPGGATDVFARKFAQILSERWGQPVVVENRAGAGGVVGTDVVAKSAPDGYTLYWGANGALTINPSLQTNPTFEPLRDLSPVARLLVTCELLDRDGFPLGAGFGATYDVPSGESRPIRAVVYGVRDFAAARVAVTSAALDQVGGR